MIISEKQGNLFDVKEGWIAHGCNCQGLMGSGVAKAMRDLYPHVYDEYNNCLKTGKYQLGDNIPAVAKSMSVNQNYLFVVNMLTQQNVLSPHNPVPVSYQAIKSCFSKMNETLMSEQTLHIPRIGAGLARGDWETITDIINEVSDYKVQVWYLV